MSKTSGPVGWFRGLLGRQPGEAPATALLSPGETEPPNPSLQQVENETRALLASKGRAGANLVAGAILMVGVGDVRRQYGTGWPSVLRRVHNIVAYEIKGRIGPDDLFTRRNDDSYVLCFVDPDADSAQAVVSKISDAIAAALEAQLPNIGHFLKIRHTVAELKTAPILESNRLIADVIGDALQQIRCEAEEVANARRAALLRDARVVFKPVWHVQKRVVPIFRCLLDSASGRSTLETFRSISEESELVAAVADLDYLIFGRALQSLHGMIKSDGRANLLVPVNFNTLHQKSTRDEYARLCAQVPTPYQRYLIFHLHGVTTTVPATRLAELIQLLKGNSVGVVLELPNLSMLALDIAALSLGIAVKLDLASMPTVQARKMAQAAAALQLKSFAHGANTLGALNAAVEYGFDYVEGEAVHPTLNEPKSLFHLNPLAV